VSGVGNGTVSTGLANLASVYSNKKHYMERTFQTNLGFDLSCLKRKT
jgi:hypothetical protein